MARYIDADFVLPHIEEEITICKEQETVNPTASANRVGLQVARSFIVTAPTADVVEVKHGEWKHECLECSVCKRNISEICDADSYLTSGIEYELLFCPFCGAKMDGQTPQKLNHNSLCETETYKVGE